MKKIIRLILAEVKRILEIKIQIIIINLKRQISQHLKYKLKTFKMLINQYNYHRITILKWINKLKLQEIKIE